MIPNGSLDTIIKLNVQEKGSLKAMQIHAAAGLFTSAMLVDSMTQMEMVLCLAQGCGVTDKDIEEAILASQADVEMDRKGDRG